MSEFDYLSRMALGQYLPLDSALHRRDARAKLIGFTLLILGITLARSWAGLCVALAAVSLLLWISKAPFFYTLRSLLPPLPFILFLALIQLFITPHAPNSDRIFSLWGMGVFPEGVSAAILMVLKFINLILLFSVSSASLSTLELIHGVDLLFKPLQKLGLRTEGAAMTLQITFRFVPFLALNAERIAKAQASRGAEWGGKKGGFVSRVRQIYPLLIPLFTSSLRQAETLADAMLARGYSGATRRTSMQACQFTWKDGLFILLLSAAALIALALPA